MKEQYVQILVGFLSFASIHAYSQNYPKCYICGTESDVVKNPDSVIPISDGYDTPVKEVDCATLDESGKNGTISEDECTDLQNSAVLKSFCGCLRTTEEAPSKPLDVPMYFARPLLDKTPAASPTATPIGSKLPTTSPAMYTEDGVRSAEPSTSPSNTPSDSPSNVPSNTPSEFPSEIPSSKPFLDTKDISGVDSSTDTSGRVATSLGSVFAMGVIVAMTFLS
jgi:hypothetical protein